MRIIYPGSQKLVELLLCLAVTFTVQISMASGADFSDKCRASLSPEQILTLEDHPPNQSTAEFENELKAKRPLASIPTIKIDLPRWYFKLIAKSHYLIDVSHPVSSEELREEILNEARTHEVEPIRLANALESRAKQAHDLHKLHNLPDKYRTFGPRHMISRSKLTEADLKVSMIRHYFYRPEQIEIPALRAAAESVYEIRNGLNQLIGTAFLADRDGLLVTNDHVIEDFKSIHDVKITFKGELVRTPGLKLVNRIRAPGIDLALLRAPELIERPHLQFVNETYGKISEPAFALGYPAFLDLKSILTYAHLEMVFGEPYGFVAPGNSGGPVVNKDGRVIGVIWGGALGPGRADYVPIGYVPPAGYTPVGEIRRLLKR